MKGPCEWRPARFIPSNFLGFKADLLSPNSGPDRIYYFDFIYNV